MMRDIVVFLIGVGCLILSGCVAIRADPSLHPHSAVITPTFCLYKGNDPKPIVSIMVERRSKDDGLVCLTRKSKLWNGAGNCHGLPDSQRASNAWILEYAPDTSYPSTPF